MSGMRLRRGAPEEAGLSSRLPERIEELAGEWVKEGVHSALVVLVARRGVIAYHEAFGRLGPEPDAPPLEIDAIFPVASLTKPITATALMILVEEGRVGLTRPVHEYIPEFQGDGKENVCVHHLLTHTSGLRDEDVMPRVMETWNQPDVPGPEEGQDPGVHKWLSAAAGAPQWKKPGEEMAYCNANYVCLGEILRRVTGQSLAGFAGARIFEPLGLVDTNFVVPEAARPRVVRTPPGWLPPPLDDERFVQGAMGAAGAHSTALDVAVFGQTFLDGGTYGDVRILARSTVGEMTRNQIPGVGARLGDEYHREASWGYGWVISSAEKWTHFFSLPEGSFNHPGGTGAFLWCDPAQELVGVFLSTARYEPPYRVVWQADLFANAVTAAVES